MYTRDLYLYFLYFKTILSVGVTETPNTYIELEPKTFQEKKQEWEIRLLYT